MSVPVSDLQAIAPSSIIELFVLELNTTQHGTNDVYRFHAGSNLNSNGEVVWAGDTYLRFPVEAEGFEYSGNGQLPRPKIRVSNIFGTITALILSLPDGLEGAKMTRIRTLAKYLDAANFPSGNPTADSTAEFPREIFYVDRKSAETRDFVEYELAAVFDLAGIRAPKRQCIANICQWQYKSTECGYAGTAYFDANDDPVTSSANDVCGKRLSSCQARFKSFTVNGSVTSGSNQLVLTQSVIVGSGEAVSGFGIPAGTTVSSISGLTVTMSANATATTNVSKTGLIQSNTTEIVLVNSTGLAPSMAISGPDLADGTTIAAISGPTITLNQPAIRNYTLFATRTGSILTSRPSLASRIINVTTTGLTVGMSVLGPELPTDYSVKITFIGTDYVDLSYSVASPVSAQSFSFYTLSGYTPDTYNFSGNPRYVFRNPATDALPFGSYPGIGTYYT